MTSVVDTSVKFAVSSMQDAPLINGTAGSLIAALDAFLVNGFANKPVTSGVVSGGVCRLSFTGQSAAMTHSVILVAGITGANTSLNGEQKVTAVSSSWVEFKTDLPEGAVTGSISFKMAPLGWEKVFSKTNVAVYRQTDPASTRTYYRVDDTNALYARVQMYESMSDVDNGVGISPALAGGYYWHKRSAAGANGVYWLLIGDSRGFYYVPAPYANTSQATSASFGSVAMYAGDINSYRSGDTWCGFLSGSMGVTYSSRDGCIFQAGTAEGRSTARASHGIGASVTCEKFTLGSTAVSGNSSVMGAFPSRADNGLRLAPIVIMDGVSAAGPRGEAPGAYYCPQTGLVAGFGADVHFTPGAGFFSGKTLISTIVGDPSSASITTNGMGFFDVTTPWRP